MSCRSTNKIKLSIIFSTILLAANLTGCSPSNSKVDEVPATEAPIVLTDGLNKSIKLPKAAQRIVSLAPSSTEILYAIDAGRQVVARDTFSDYPEEAKTIPDIGGGFGELNSEAIIAQKPDLVLASSLTPPEQIKALESLGLTVFAIANPNDFSGLFQNLRAVAKLTAHEAEAETLVDELDARIKAVEEKVKNTHEKPLVFYELDGTDPNAPWTPGPGSFVDNLIRMAGGENLGSGMSSEWAQISIEELVSKDPEIILIGDATWGGVTLDDVRNRAGWESLKAIQEGRMFVFDDNLVSRPGPRLVDGLEAMAKLLHPELFQ